MESGKGDAADAPGAALRAAIDDARWADLISILGLHWTELVTGDLALVGDAFRAVPESVLAATPRRVAAKSWVEHRLRGTDPVAFRDIVPESDGGAVTDQVATLTIRIAAKRNRGDLAGAIEDVEYAQRIIDQAAEIEHVTIRHGLPIMAAQWARVYELAGNAARARELLQESYDIASLVGDDVSARNAAGRLSWFDAVEGRHEAASL
jgi:hypothetical protein